MDEQEAVDKNLTLFERYSNNKMLKSDRKLVIRLTAIKNAIYLSLDGATKKLILLNVFNK